MKITGYLQPKSSFLSVEKDMELLINKIFANQRLQKYLYYTDKDPLNKPALTSEQVLELFDTNIKIVPKIYIDRTVLQYVIVQFNNFIPSRNPEFRDNTIEFDIICHFDQWQMRDFQLRPYRIAAEIDSMLDKQRLTGIGKLEFMGLDTILLTDEYAGLCLMYRTYHGEEDKKFFNDPVEDEQFIQDFKEMQDEAMSP